MIHNFSPVCIHRDDLHYKVKSKKLLLQKYLVTDEGMKQSKTCGTAGKRHLSNLLTNYNPLWHE